MGHRRRLCGVNWEDVWAGLSSAPTHDDETVMNGAPDLVGDREIVNGRPARRVRQWWRASDG